MNKGEWAVMFVDLEGSTQMKYRDGNEASTEKVALLIERLFVSIRDLSSGKSHMKFTGDGAMVIFKVLRDEHGEILAEANGCRQALEAAERIVLQVDRDNLKFELPQAHVRIGITTGECFEISPFGPELSGRPADLAARLCGEADRDGVLVDDATRAGSGLPQHRFELCQRRLSLKGVPPGPSEAFYTYRVPRLVRPPRSEHFDKGLLSVYASRDELLHDFSPVRLLHLAEPGSSLLIGGRTLIAWTEIGSEIQAMIRRKDLRFRFLLSSMDACRFLDDEQQSEIRRHLPAAHKFFNDLSARTAGHIEVRESDQLILDGITCATVHLPVDVLGKGSGAKLVVLQDLNAASAERKATAVWACTCEGAKPPLSSCTAHGLFRRTELLFDKAAPMPSTTAQSDELQRLLEPGGEGLESRRNRLSNYLPQIVKHLRAIEARKLDEVPAPICIQMQVASTCGTFCRMCQHWREEREELPTEDWRAIFEDVARFGVRTTIFSGGEPLQRPDIAELMRAAKGSGLRIGLLTSGTGMLLGRTSKSRDDVISALAESVDWVAVSIDGTKDMDNVVRNPDPKIGDRYEMLRYVCATLKEKRPEVALSATLTLQRANIGMDLKSAVHFIRKEIGIAQVNVKLATGARKALAEDPRYLPTTADLETFESFLWQNHLPNEKGNNLDYLRRAFADDVFNRDDVADGVPVRSFYRAQKLRCFTPFLFSMIDCDGTVYPCCHLYRDNHGFDARSADFREVHDMGKVGRGIRFESVWNGSRYVDERRRLERINPDANNFVPCGECTRHCQHNASLNKVMGLVRSDAAVLDTIAQLEHDAGGAVWF